MLKNKKILKEYMCIKKIKKKSNIVLEELRL